MPRILASVAALSFVLVACSAEPAPDCAGSFHAHGSLTLEQRAVVANVFARWNTLAGREVVRLVPGDAADVTCSVRVYEGEDLGLWEPSMGSLSIAPDRMRDHAPGCAEHLDACVEAVLLHETGHALGLKHTRERSVMSEGGELVTAFTPTDMTECRRAGVCSVR